MPDILAANRLSLYELSQRFDLERAEAAVLFPEWRMAEPEVTAADREQLAAIYQEYLYLSARSLQESLVNITVIGPLLRLAGWLGPPFYVTAERQVQVETADGEAVVRGRIDLLALVGDLWVAVVEAKQVGLSLEVGIPQALVYMLASPEPGPAYALVSNGPDFAFLKLQRRAGENGAAQAPVYARTKTLSIYDLEDLAQVLRLLRWLGWQRAGQLTAPERSP